MTKPAPNPIPIQRYKVVLVSPDNAGEEGTGKTTYVERLLDKPFNQQYVPTLGVDVHPVTLQTNHGIYTLDMWDCASQERFGGLRDGYYIEAAGLAVFYSSSKNTPSGSILKKIEEIERINPGKLALIVCGTHTDCQTQWRTPVLNRHPSAPLVKVSNKAEKDQLYEPVKHLLRQLTGHKDLVVTGTL